MKQRIVLCLVPILAAAWTVTMQAQQRPERGERIATKLGLTTEQAGKIQSLRTVHMKSMVDNRAALKKVGIDLRNLRRSDEPDKSAIKAKMKEMADLRLKAANARVDHMFEVRSVLTAEQRKQWKEMRGDRLGKRDGRGVRRPGGKGMERGMMHDGARMERRERMHR